MTGTCNLQFCCATTVYHTSGSKHTQRTGVRLHYTHNEVLWNMCTVSIIKGFRFCIFQCARNILPSSRSVPVYRAVVVAADTAALLRLSVAFCTVTSIVAVTDVLAVNGA